MLALRPTTLSKRDSSTTAFLWILRIFLEHLLYKTPPSNYFWKIIRTNFEIKPFKTLFLRSCTKSDEFTDQNLWSIWLSSSFQVFDMYEFITAELSPYSSLSPLVKLSWLVTSFFNFTVPLRIGFFVLWNVYYTNI